LVIYSSTSPCFNQDIIEHSSWPFFDKVFLCPVFGSVENRASSLIFQDPLWQASVLNLSQDYFISGRTSSLIILGPGIVIAIFSSMSLITAHPAPVRLISNLR
jgi:hypothetical protein